mgnify:CR=1 FL=1
MDIQIRSFSELTTSQLYEILQIRAAVFIVEQDCVYQDIDGKDQKALHMLGYDTGVLVAYTRIFKASDYLPKASIGRVLVHMEHRKKAFGREIMQASIQAVNSRFKSLEIEISAQTYLLEFYQSLGFIAIGDGYLEDGIPHINMLRTQTS